MPLNPKICEVIDMIDSSLNWSLSENEKDKKIAVYHIGLDGISDDQIQIGLVKQLKSNSRDFPTPGQFRELCKPAKRPGLLLLTFEQDIKDNKLNQENCVAILAQLGVNMSDNGKVEKETESSRAVDKQVGKLSKLIRTIKKYKG